MRAEIRSGFGCVELRLRGTSAARNFGCAELRLRGTSAARDFGCAEPHVLDDFGGGILA
jgi:hypothetical protein